MVVFTCNACGESVKKVQVEKHVNICRNCQCLSCMDCGKDFWGDDYKCHVKCLSEDQKYGGKGFEAKTHKGDVKQQEWIQIGTTFALLQSAGTSPVLQELSKMIASEFFCFLIKQNWMANSLKIHNKTLQDQVWDIFSEATKKVSPQQEIVESSSTKNEDVPTPSEVKTKISTTKKSKKEERENMKKSKSHDHVQQESEDLIKSKKSKKENTNAAFSKTNYLKTKHQQAVVSADMEVNGHNPDVKEPKAKASAKKRKRNLSEGTKFTLHAVLSYIKHLVSYSKFRWKETIKAVLKQAPDNEISIKKLRKKVIAQYYAVAADHHKSEEEILALFNKKVSKNPKFRVLKEKVKLIK
uniref:Ly1 antibody reactive n=1 Tax=Anolis carolinensis TaxID=28377 RepID=A0A803TH19_ANOCA